MHVGIVYNPRPEGYERDSAELEKYIEGDEWKTIEAIGMAIDKNGHAVSYITFDQDIYHKLETAKDEIDLLFNLSEGMVNTRDREAQLPMLAELLNIPYTGPAPLECALILNKHRAKQIWSASGIATAHSQLFTSHNDTLDPTLSYPLLVKPNTDGSGIGIHNNSIVKSEGELRTAVDRILTEYHQDALVETYLPGREFTVSIVGNGTDLTVLPLIEINFAAFPDGTPAIDSYEAKFVYGVTGQAAMHDTEICPAVIDKKLEKQIVDLARRAYTSIGCRDFGRLDIRLSAEGIPHVLEINYPPGLMSDPDESSFFTISARATGWDFAKLIGEILTTACQRQNIQPRT